MCVCVCVYAHVYLFLFVLAYLYVCVCDARECDKERSEFCAVWDEYIMFSCNVHWSPFKSKYKFSLISPLEPAQTVRGRTRDLLMFGSSVVDLRN